MRAELTAQQEDFLLEQGLERARERQDIEQEKKQLCEFCNNSYPKDEITTAKIENGEEVNICLNCDEDLRNE